jgi:hypothetical protein
LKCELPTFQVGCLDADLIALFVRVFFTAAREDTLAGSESRPHLPVVKSAEEEKQAADGSSSSTLQEVGSETLVLSPTPSASAPPQLLSPTAVHRSISRIPSRFNSPAPAAAPLGVGVPDPSSEGDAGSVVPSGAGSLLGSGQDSGLAIEMLQLGTLLLKHVPELMRQHPNQMVTFGWQGLKVGLTSRVVRNLSFKMRNIVLMKKKAICI